MEQQTDGKPTIEEWHVPLFLVVDANGLVVAQGLERDETLQMAVEECHAYAPPLRIYEAVHMWTVHANGRQDEDQLSRR